MVTTVGKDGGEHTAIIGDQHVHEPLALDTTLDRNFVKGGVEDLLIVSHKEEESWEEETSRAT